MNHFGKIVIFLTILITHACSGTYRVVEFEVLEPAKITLPEDVRQLLILNRLPPYSITIDSSIKSMLSEDQLAGLDTLVAHNIFRGLFGVLKQSPLESYYWPVWAVERQPRSPAAITSLLTQREVVDFCEQNFSDAILSLESVQLDFEYLGFANVWNTASVPVYTSKLKSKWLIYLPGNPGPIKEDTMENSIFRTPFPSPEVYSGMIKDVSNENGEQYGQHICPVWKSEKRNIFAGAPAELRKGGRETDNGNWEKAYQYWSDLSVSGDSLEKAKALFNMAVYYELEDKLDSSLFLLDCAITLDSLAQIREYQKDINLRIQKKQDISRQVEKTSM